MAQDRLTSVASRRPQKDDAMLLYRSWNFFTWHFRRFPNIGLPNLVIAHTVSTPIG